jgi:hypothetical protein
MRKDLTDYFIWHCEWCDSTHLVPKVLQHEYRHFCSACNRLSADWHMPHDFVPVYPI